MTPAELTVAKLGCRSRALTKLKDMYPDDFEVLYRAELKAAGIKRKQDMTKAELKAFNIARLKEKIAEMEA